ncbi:MAG: right-handed parallel beta-helix repeat-containing protein [Chloroflexi bacterium]|nr:right-handed parallel beta-helix repeat-containing protein [Chloroflexota bacterium]
MSNHKRIFLLVILILSIVFAVGPAQVARATVTFTVNNNGDSVDFLLDGICETATDNGICTLRAAIQEANSEIGIDIIEFDLVGSPYIIAPGTALPIIDDTIIIDGTSQTDYSTGNPVLEIDGGGQSFNGLEFSSDGNMIVGLVIRDFDGDAIKITGSAGGSTISGNYIGVEIDGNTPDGNSVGIHILDSPGNLIGGSVAGEENVISGNGTGIIIEGAASDLNTIIRNIIGMNAAIDAGVGNTAEGILIDAAINTTIGSTNTNKLNVVSSNDSHGIKITNSAAGTRILGNSIGTGLSGTGVFGNGGHGVWLDSSENRVGGTNSGAKNSIRFNAGNGVTVSAGEKTNTIIGNAILDNDGLGIDLGDDGITVNDVGDEDDGANWLINYPIVSTASLSGSTLNIRGGYNSKGPTSFRLEFFSNTDCDPLGNGEGAKRIYSLKIIMPASGNYTIDISLTSTVTVGMFITATATWLEDGSTPEDTSEFSPCWLVSAVSATATNTPAPTATPTDDGGGGSINSPTPTNTPTPTITGTPPTNTPSPTITPNDPEKTLTALATINAPSPTSTFSPFISTNTLTPSSTFNLTDEGTGGGGPSSIPTAIQPTLDLRSVGDQTATAEAGSSVINFGGFEIPRIILNLCIGAAVLLLLAGGVIELVRWLNSRREDDEETF